MSTPFIFVLPMAAFTGHWQSWTFSTKTIQIIKPKMFTLALYRKSWPIPGIESKIGRDEEKPSFKASATAPTQRRAS